MCGLRVFGSPFADFSGKNDAFRLVGRAPDGGPSFGDLPGGCDVAVTHTPNVLPAAPPPGGRFCENEALMRALHRTPHGGVVACLWTLLPLGARALPHERGRRSGRVGGATAFRASSRPCATAARADGRGRCAAGREGRPARGLQHRPRADRLRRTTQAASWAGRPRRRRGARATAAAQPRRNTSRRSRRRAPRSHPATFVPCDAPPFASLGSGLCHELRSEV